MEMAWFLASAARLLGKAEVLDVQRQSKHGKSMARVTLW